MRALVAYVLDLGRRTLERFVELEGFDRAMSLAGQAFAALLPLLIIVGAASPVGGKELADGLVARLDLEGQSAAALQAAVAEPAAVQDSITLLSALVLIISALSFTRALQRLYVRAWRLPRIGVYGNVWGLEWLAAFCVYWSLQPIVIGVFGGVAERVVAVALTCALWLFTPWILVGRQIPWRRLLPQAVLTSGGLAALTAASVIYLPRSIASAANQFGFIGVAVSLLSLLFIAAVVLVVTAALGAVGADSGREGDAAALRAPGTPRIARAG